VSRPSVALALPCTDELVCFSSIEILPTILNSLNAVDDVQPLTAVTSSLALLVADAA
jgi:hypothetical protein